MSDDQYMKLFKYMQTIDNKVDVIVESMATKDDIRRLESLIDGYAAKLDSYAMEMAAMQHKIDRLEKYIQVLAKKANVDLDAIHA